MNIYYLNRLISTCKYNHTLFLKYKLQGNSNQTFNNIFYICKRHYLIFYFFFLKRLQRWGKHKKNFKPSPLKIK